MTNSTKEISSLQLRRSTKQQFFFIQCRTRFTRHFSTFLIYYMNNYDVNKTNVYQMSLNWNKFFILITAITKFCVSVKIMRSGVSFVKYNRSIKKNYNCKTSNCLLKDLFAQSWTLGWETEVEESGLETMRWQMRWWQRWAPEPRFRW